MSDLIDKHVTVEQCAQIADEYARIWRRGVSSHSAVRAGAAEEIAHAIRASVKTAEKQPASR